VEEDMQEGNIELNPELVLRHLDTISDSPHSAILYFLNNIGIERPDLLERCAEVAAKFEVTFEKLYRI